MELGRTENSEIIFIHTDDLEVTIKGGASGDPPPFVMPDQMESSVAVTCNAGFTPSVRGRAKVSSDAVFARQMHRDHLLRPSILRADQLYAHRAGK